VKMIEDMDIIEFLLVVFVIISIAAAGYVAIYKSIKTIAADAAFDVCTCDEVSP
jgi:hypothetical protein